MKLCTVCCINKKASSEPQEGGHPTETEMDTGTDSDDYIPQAEKEEQLNQIITSLGVSPVKVPKFSAKDRISYTK